MDCFARGFKQSRKQRDCVDIWLFSRVYLESLVKIPLDDTRNSSSTQLRKENFLPQSCSPLWKHSDTLPLVMMSVVYYVVLNECDQYSILIVLIESSVLKWGLVGLSSTASRRFLTHAVSCSKVWSWYRLNELTGSPMNSSGPSVVDLVFCIARLTWHVLALFAKRWRWYGAWCCIMGGLCIVSTDIIHDWYVGERQSDIC